MKDAYYFSHDSNARHDPKILSMISVYGMAGYGWYWVIIEILREQEDYKFSITKEHSYNAIAMQLYIDCNAAKKFIDDCINEFELFVSDGQCFWSESLLERMQILADKRRKLSENAAKRWEKQAQKNDSNAIAMQLQCKSNASKVKESKVNNIKEYKEKEIPYNKIKDLYLTNCTLLPEIKDLTDKRKISIKARWKKYYDLSIFENLFKKANSSAFLTGDNDKNWTANFDWLLNENNMIKVLEGNYDNKRKMIGGKKIEKL
jgi:hypothetical protein